MARLPRLARVYWPEQLAGLQIPVVSGNKAPLEASLKAIDEAAAKRARKLERNRRQASC